MSIHSLQLSNPFYYTLFLIPKDCLLDSVHILVSTIEPIFILSNIEAKNQQINKFITISTPYLLYLVLYDSSILEFGRLSLFFGYKIFPYT